MRRALSALPAVLLLVGCTQAPGDRAPVSGPAPALSVPAPAPVIPQARPDAAPDAVPIAATVHLALSGEGLTFAADSGSTRHVEFGVPAATAIEAASRVIGTAPEIGHNGECGAGPLDMATWPNGLTLVSQDGRFVGWSIDPAGSGRALSTLAGVGLGSTRAELESAYTAEVSETTLGTEFLAGGLSGVLEGTGTAALITALWAGTNCIFR